MARYVTWKEACQQGISFSGAGRVATRPGIDREGFWGKEVRRFHSEKVDCFINGPLCSTPI